MLFKQVFCPCNTPYTPTSASIIVPEAILAFLYFTTGSHFCCYCIGPLFSPIMSGVAVNNAANLTGIGTAMKIGSIYAKCLFSLIIIELLNIDLSLSITRVICFRKLKVSRKPHLCLSRPAVGLY